MTRPEAQEQRPTERQQYHDFSQRIARAYGQEAHSVYVDARLRDRELLLTLQVFNRAGYTLSPKPDAAVTDLTETAATLLGAGHWLLEGKRARPDPSTAAKSGWRPHPQTTDDDD